MKQKLDVLLVDDEPAVLDALKFIFAEQQRDWNFHYATGGQEALDFLKDKSCDIIVTDMRMPEIDGAEVLRQVKDDNPRAMRVILSGYEEKLMTVRSVDIAHRYMMKPCQIEDLQYAVDCYQGIQGRLDDPTLLELVASVDKLPTPPVIYQRMVKAIEKEETTLEDLAEILEEDPAMTAKVLKLVNSSFFGIGAQSSIGSPSEAIGMLGLDTLRALILLAQMFDEASGLSMDVINLEAVWTQSTTVSGIARTIAKLDNPRRDVVDFAFVAGLLHCVGKLVLATRFTEQYLEVVRESRRSKQPIHLVEEKHFGVNNAVIGGYLLSLWGMPSPILEGVLYQYNPEGSPYKERTPLTYCYAACAFYYNSVMENPNENIFFNRQYMERMGLTTATLDYWRNACNIQKH